MRESTKTAIFGFVRLVGVALVTAVVIIGVLALAYGGQSREESQTLQEIRNGTLAQVCVLALPVDPVTGRDDAAVRRCLEDNGLTGG